MISDATRQSWAALKADTHRYFGRWSVLSLLKGVLLRRTFRPVATMRFCQLVHGLPTVFKPLLLVGRLLHRVACNSASIDFPWETSVGAGICLTHGWGMVVNSGVTIGRNVTLFHGVTLGRRDRLSAQAGRTIEYPDIEDEVWIGPHAVVVGGVTVGRGSRIAAGSLVVESIPPYSVVSGNPSTIVKTGCVPDVFNPAPLSG